LHDAPSPLDSATTRRRSALAVPCVDAEAAANSPRGYASSSRKPQARRTPLAKGHQAHVAYADLCGDRARSSSPTLPAVGRIPGSARSAGRDPHSCSRRYVRAEVQLHNRGAPGQARRRCRPGGCRVLEGLSGESTGDDCLNGEKGALPATAPIISRASHLSSPRPTKSGAHVLLDHVRCASSVRRGQAQESEVPPTRYEITRAGASALDTASAPEGAMSARKAVVMARSITPLPGRRERENHRVLLSGKALANDRLQCVSVEGGVHECSGERPTSSSLA
jgi:hypothetical protein